MSRPIYVNAALLTEMLSDELSRATAKPGTWRAVIAACVLGGGGVDTKEWCSPQACRAGRQIWPVDALERPGRMTVLKVLMELESLRIICALQPHDDGFTCRYFTDLVVPVTSRRIREESAA